MSTGDSLSLFIHVLIHPFGGHSNVLPLASFKGRTSILTKQLSIVANKRKPHQWNVWWTVSPWFTQLCSSLELPVETRSLSLPLSLSLAFFKLSNKHITHNDTQAHVSLTHPYTHTITRTPSHTMKYITNTIHKYRPLTSPLPNSIWTATFSKHTSQYMQPIFGTRLTTPHLCLANVYTSASHV